MNTQLRVQKLPFLHQAQYINGNKHKMSVLKVAITQAEPEWLDLARSVEKTIDLIAEAAKGGAHLVAFPECWIAGYPGWIW